MKTPLRPFLPVTLVVALMAAGCGQDHTRSGSGTAAASATAATSARPAAVVHQNWSTGPVTVAHNPAVPPVPVVTGIRYAGHPADGYDRIVFDIKGALPGYAARYVSQVRADGSGNPITVPGRSFLLIVLNPAQAHTDAGAVTVSGVHRVDLPMLTAYAIAGDFEGHVSIALGLNATAGYRVGELSGRIYVDVAT
jgi:hypothetical protein